MSADSKKGIIATAVTVLCALVLYGWFGGGGPSFDVAEHTALGEVAAEQALKLVGPNGRVTLIARDTEAYPNPATDAQLAGFKRAMKRSGGRVGAIQLLKQNPLRVVAVPSGDFLELLRKNTDSDVIVSFLGPAVLDDARIAALGEKRPKIVALCSGWMPRRVDLRRLFQQGLLTVAIVSRDGSSPRSRDGRERFNSLFTIVTSANASDLPFVARSSP
jgi:hypothetical protein